MATTVKVSRETKERLRQRGEKGDTYEDIIIELLDEAEGQEESDQAEVSN